VKVLYFSVAAQAAGTNEEPLDTASSLTADQLWELLVKRHPALAEIRANCRLARNGSFADAAEEFSNQDEVAVLPPFSGG
jgi:molybdopterin converting factor subunit 1